MTTTAMFILSVELVPTRQRNLVNGWASCLWVFGYPVAAGIGYFVPDWNYMFLAASVFYMFTTLSVFFCIESPKFYLINNNEEAAKRAFQALARLNNMELDLEKREISDTGRAQKREQSTRQQLVDFVKFPSLRLECGILMALWFVVAMFYFGFNFGWGKIVPDLYLGYVVAGSGELISYVLLVPLIAVCGRRRAMMFLFAGSALFFLLAIPDLELGAGWSLNSVSCLVGIVFVSGSFSGVYLWTGEIAPTSHAGLVFCLCSGAARFGSFLGPYIFNNLAPITHRAVPLGGLALIALLCAFGSFIMVETGNSTIVLTGVDVEERRRNYRYQI